MNRPDNASIQAALAAIPDDGDFDASAANLLAALGYRSDRTLAGQSGAVGEFFGRFPGGNPDTDGERALRREARSVRLLFQLTEAEIPQGGAGRLFASDADGAGDFRRGNARSFLFAAIDLHGAGYPRGRYAAFTREINRRFQAPAAVLFRTAANQVSLAFVHRRPNQVHSGRDVLGRVSLIREIDADNPHRAHLDILADLSLPERRRWMDASGQPCNFDGLLAAWLDALDTRELNRSFYRELFGWFEGAAATAQFPAGPQSLPPEEHLIRLITRLMFAWFIKEKGLVAGELFIENQAAGLLKDYDRASGDSYYRAILQNLFFATLNTEIGQRRFSRKTQEDHRNFSVYRYEDEIADRDRLLALFAKTPFINGGLFDCLDSFDAAGAGGVRIDCFTDNPQQRRGYSLPNRLFFGGDGLISLFENYKFTVEENTPAEEEVALDPELLGQVFENLLAAVNPETRLTARKETGSYYTPRPVVDYMADEALTGALAQKARPDDDGSAAQWRERLRRLLDYAAPEFAGETGDAAPPFSEAESESLVTAIAGLKILDPAVGSGAFPMGVLHKLTLALRRLDPDNRLWEKVQREQAIARSAGAYEQAGGQAARDAELQEISANFQRYRDSDYGRKLYLIQHSIYGVDIQPIATQIAKLRCFISLAIEQQPNGAAGDNYGIRPLPNLETRFVAADALLALARPRQLSLGQTGAVRRLERELEANRERHFHAAHRQAKRECRRADERLRRQLAKALEAADFSAAAADKVAQWNPYDQNGQADWFDPEYMFGVAEGFDVVIGNPPYVVTKDQRLRKIYAEGIYGRMNTYGLFIQRGLQLTGEAGQLCYINPRTLLTGRYFSNLRKVIRKQAELKGVVLIADRHHTFENVLQECIIPHFVRKDEPALPHMVSMRNISVPSDLHNPKAGFSVSSSRVFTGEEFDGAFYVADSEFAYQVFERMQAAGGRLAGFGLKAETGKLQFDKYQQYAQPANGAGAGRLIWAENIQRYALRPSRHRVGKEWLAPGITSAVPPNITGAGIVTQRTTATEQARRIIATLVTPQSAESQIAYSENGTNFVALSESAAPASFLLGALNSILMEFLFRRLNSNVHVSAGEINQLPFPPLPGPRQLQEIDELVSGLLQLGGVDCGPAAAAQAMTWEHRLDLLIGGLYGFSPAEVEQIQQSLPPYEAVYGLPPPSSGSGIADRGQAIYDAKIRPRLGEAEVGKLAVIDIYSGDYEIDADYAAATRRLLLRRPGVITYAVRVGHPAAFKLRSPRRAPHA